MVTVHTLTKLAGPPRIELGLTGSKPVVLPLHHEPIKLYYWCSYQESNLEYSLTMAVLCHLTIRANLAEAVRFELTEHFCSTVFKTAALSRAQPHFHVSWAVCCTLLTSNT